MYGVGVATTVVVVAAVLLLRVRPDTPHLPDIAEPTQSQLNQQAENVTREPVVNQEPVVPPTREAVADGDKRTQLPDPRPKNYNSLPTGTRCEEDVGPSGHGPRLSP